LSNNIELRVTNNVTYLMGRLPSDVYQELKKAIGYYPENVHWMITQAADKAAKAEEENNNKKWLEEWDGHISTLCWNRKYCRCSIPKTGTHFPTGMLGRVMKFFRQSGIAFDISDHRFKTEKSFGYSMSDDFESRDYQQQIIDEVVGVNGKRPIDRGIIKCATGGGKTAIACGIIAGLGVTPAIFYVPSRDLLRQAADEISKFIHHMGVPVEVGMLGGGYKEIKDINVMTIQTAVRALGKAWVKFDDEDVTKDDTDIDDMKPKIRDLIKDCRLMICDEVQHWAAEICQIISDHSLKCQYRYGFSATPWRDKGDDILIDGCFGKKIADINASFLIERGYLAKPTIFFQKIANMRGITKTNYANVYKRAIVDNEFRNNRVVQFAQRFERDGRNILILVRQINHGKKLEALIPGSVFIHGTCSKKKRHGRLEEMRQGGPCVTIASVIFDEGIDCRPLDTLILAGGGKSPTRALQRIGRVLRIIQNKKDAIVVDFMDYCKYMQGHSRKRKNIYKTEPQFEIIGVD